MVAYRIEHKETAIGPFRSNIDFYNGHLNEDYNKATKMYSPEDDPQINRSPKEHEICAFPSLELLIIFFTDQLIEALETKGFAVYEIETNSVTAIGEHQILFDKNDYLRKTCLTVN